MAALGDVSQSFVSIPEISVEIVILEPTHAMQVVFTHFFHQRSAAYPQPLGSASNHARAIVQRLLDQGSLWT